MIFTYEEIVSCTEGFSDSNLLGHGTYGSVYYGLLRDQVWCCYTIFIVNIYSSVFRYGNIIPQNAEKHRIFQEVAIKRMTEMKTKEFMLEMKVLCKVHHTNLVMHIAFQASPVPFSSELIATLQHSKSFILLLFCQGRIDWLRC